mgnify:CR=1 FL=1
MSRETVIAVAVSAVVVGTMAIDHLVGTELRAFRYQNGTFRDLNKLVPRDSGVFLENILEGGPTDVKHHRIIERYLKSDMPRGDQYVDYRAAMIKLLSQ